MRTSPEVSTTRADAGRALWRMADDGRADCDHDQRGKITLGPPKSRAARRVVGVPAAIVPVLREHMKLFVKAEPDPLIFPGVVGGPLVAGGPGFYAHL